MPVAAVEVDEVEHVAHREAVDQVARRAADERRRGDSGEQQRLERKVNVVEKPVCRARVVHPRQIEEAGDDGHALVQRQAAPHHRLDELIEQHDDRHDDDLGPAGHREGHRLNASRQRSQMPDHSGSLRTDGTKRQQRAHFTPGAFSTATVTVSAPSAVPRCRATSETLNSIGKCAWLASSSATTGPLAVRATRAPRAFPMTLSFRFSSSAALTVSRTASSRSQVASTSELAKWLTEGKFSRCTDSLR